MKASKNNIILFDGVCNLCNSSVQFIIKHDIKKTFSFASLQSDAAKELLSQHNNIKDDFTSIILIQNGKAYTRSTAALRIAKELSMPVKLLYGFIIVPTFVRNWVYGIISRNRYKWFGKQDNCMIPTPELKNRFLN